MKGECLKNGSAYCPQSSSVLVTSLQICPSSFSSQEPVMKEEPSSPLPSFLMATFFPGQLCTHQEPGVPLPLLSRHLHTCLGSQVLGHHKELPHTALFDRDVVWGICCCSSFWQSAPRGCQRFCEQQHQWRRAEGQCYTVE